MKQPPRADDRTINVTCEKHIHERLADNLNVNFYWNKSMISTANERRFIVIGYWPGTKRHRSE